MQVVSSKFIAVISNFGYIEYVDGPAKFNITKSDCSRCAFNGMMTPFLARYHRNWRNSIGYMGVRSPTLYSRRGTDSLTFWYSQVKLSCKLYKYYTTYSIIDLLSVFVLTCDTRIWPRKRGKISPSAVAGHSMPDSGGQTFVAYLNRISQKSTPLTFWGPRRSHSSEVLSPTFVVSVQRDVRRYGAGVPHEPTKFYLRMIIH